MVPIAEHRACSQELPTMPPRTIEGVEELRKLVGQEIGTSDWLQVTQEMIDSFSDVTRDKQ